VASKIRRVAKKVEIRPEEIEKLAGLQLTQRAISGWYGLSPSTLTSRLRSDPMLRAAYERGRAGAQISVVQKIYLQAIGDPDDPKSGNPTLLMFLAKNMCGMDGTGVGKGPNVRSYELDLATDAAAGDKEAIDGAASELASWTTDQMRRYVETGEEPITGMAGVEDEDKDKDAYRPRSHDSDEMAQYGDHPAIISTRTVDSDGLDLGDDPIDVECFEID